MIGVSEVIAIILILMITISLAGLAYMFMSTTMSDVTASAGSTVGTTTSSMLTSFAIESIDIAKVYVRNTGQNALTGLSVYVNDEPVIFNMTPTSIAAGAVGTITIYSFIPDGATVKITSPSGFSTSKVAQPCTKAVGCWKFDEDYNEVNPIVITDDGQTAFWTSMNGYGTGTIGVPSVSNVLSPVPASGADSMRITVGPGSFSKWFVQHVYATPQDWSGKSSVGIWWYGTNSGGLFALWIKSAANDKASYQFQDNFIGWKHFVFSKSTPSSTVGSLNWSSISYITVETASDNISGTFYIDRYTLDDFFALFDSSKNNNNGIPVNMVIGTNVSGPTTGKFGNGLLFDGINDYVNVGNSGTLNPSNAITISAWIRPNAGYGQSAPKIVSSSTGSYEFYINSANGIASLLLNSGNGIVYGSSAVPINSWTFLVGTYDSSLPSSQLKIYINGVLAGTSNYSSTIVAGGTVYIGNRIDLIRTFNGTIDEVRIYNRAIY